MKLKYRDYTPPPGDDLHIATKHGLLPVSSRAGALALMGSVIVAGIGDLDDAMAYQAEIDAAVVEALEREKD